MQTSRCVHQMLVLLTAPEYFSSHKVKMSHWNYPPEDGIEPSTPSLFFYADFSEPVSSALLADHIPASVRAMFQQNKLDQLDEDENSDDNSVPEAERPRLEPHQQPIHENGIDDVAENESSPMSIRSSVTSSLPPSSPKDSPSLSRDDHEARTEMTSVQEDTGAGLMSTAIALSVDGGPRDDSGECDMRSDVGLSSAENSEAPAQSVQSKTATVALLASLSGTQEAVANGSQEEFVASQNESLSSDAASSEVESRARVESTNESGRFPEENVADVDGHLESGEDSSKGSTKRHRLSSFKPNGATRSDVTSDEVPGPSSSAGNQMTSDQLQARLASGSLAVSAGACTGKGDSDEEAEEEQVTSPLPVTDLAKGHKSLKDSKKSRNRRSWFGRDSPLTRSFSLDTGLSSEQQEKRKSQSMFRGLFSSSHTYSVKKKSASPSDQSLDLDPMPGSKRRRRWRFFGKSNREPGQRRFSFVRFFSRKRRRHTTTITSTDIGKPTPPNEVISGGAYSVFRYESPGKPESERPNGADALSAPDKNTPEVRMRDGSESGTSQHRPVSFSTFQQLPADFPAKLSPSLERDGDVDDRRLSPKARAHFRLPETKLPISTVTLPSPDRERSQSRRSLSLRSDTSSPKVKAPRTPPNYENWGGRTPPAKPVRRHSRIGPPPPPPVVKSAPDTVVTDGAKDNDVKGSPSSSVSDDAGAPLDLRGAGQIAVPTPIAFPRDTIKRDCAKDVEVAEAGIQRTDVERLDLSQLDSDDEDVSKEGGSPQASGQLTATPEIEGSLVGEIMACLKERTDQQVEEHAGEDSRFVETAEKEPHCEVTEVFFKPDENSEKGSVDEDEMAVDSDNQREDLSVALSARAQDVREPDTVDPGLRDLEGEPRDPPEFETKVPETAPLRSAFSTEPESSDKSFAKDDGDGGDMDVAQEQSSAEEEDEETASSVARSVSFHEHSGLSEAADETSRNVVQNVGIDSGDTYPNDIKAAKDASELVTDEDIIPRDAELDCVVDNEFNLRQTLETNNVMNPVQAGLAVEDSKLSDEVELAGEVKAVSDDGAAERAAFSEPEALGGAGSPDADTTPLPGAAAAPGTPESISSLSSGFNANTCEAEIEEPSVKETPAVEQDHTKNRIPDDLPPPPPELLLPPDDVAGAVPVSGTNGVTGASPVVEASLSPVETTPPSVPSGPKRDFAVRPQKTHQSFVAPRLLGQNVTPKPFAKVTVPAVSSAPADPLASTQPRPPLFKPHRAPSGFKPVKHVTGPSKPPLPPKPAFLG